MKKYTSWFLITLLIFQNFILSCSLPNNFINPNNNNEKISFIKKSVPDTAICTKSNFVGISVSKNTAKSINDFITITTNIPQKLQDWVNIAFPITGYKKDFVVKIESKTNDNIFTQVIQQGCNSFDLDLLQISKNDDYEIKIYLKVTDLSIPSSLSFLYPDYISYYNFNKLSFLSSEVGGIKTAIVLCSGVVTEIGDTMDSYNQYIPKSAHYSTIENCTNPKPVFADEDRRQAITSASFTISDVVPEPPLDPATTKFFEVEDFKKLSDYANALQIDDNSANALYDQSKILESFLARKQSLIDRGSTDTAKMAEIDASIADINTSISSLQGSVLGQLSSLYNQANVLANHVNSITKEAYITPYLIEEKPITSRSYYDKAYFADLDTTNILSDGVTLYNPDKDDPIQDKLKEAWEVKGDRVEIINPNKLFRGSKYIFDEIQTSKDLMNDIINSNFNTSGNNLSSEKTEAISTLKNLISQISYHKKLLNVRSLKMADDYYYNYQDTLESTLQLKAYFLLELAEAKNKIDSNDTFLLQSLRKDFDDDSFSTKGGYGDRNNYKPKHGHTLTFEQITEIFKKYGGLAFDILNTPLPEQELQTRLMLGYSDATWKEIKKNDPDTIKALVEATMAMASSSIIYPTTYLDLFFGAGKFFKGAKALSKVNLKDVKAFIAEAKLIKNQAVALTERLKKHFSKPPCYIISKGFGGKSFHTQGSTFPCPDFDDLIQVNIKLWDLRGTTAKLIDFESASEKAVARFNNRLNEYKHLVTGITNSNDIRKKAFGMIEKFKKDGIRIKSTGFPKFKPDYVLDEFPLGRVFDADILKDFRLADKALAEKLVANNILTGTATAKMGEDFRSTYKLSWHHFEEDLETLQLIPQAIHDLVKHSGGNSITRDLTNASRTEAGVFTRFTNWAKSWF